MAQITETTHKLIADGLPRHLMDILKKTSAQQSGVGGKPEERKKYYLAEQSQAALCLFLIYYKTNIAHNEADVMDLLDLYRDCALRLQTNNQDSEFACITYLLLLTVLAVLDVNAELTDPRSNTDTISRNSLVDVAVTFKEKMKQHLSDRKRWGRLEPSSESPVMLGLAHFMWSTLKDKSEENISKYIQLAIAKGAFLVLYAILQSPLIKQDKYGMKWVFGSVMHDLLFNLVNNMPQTMGEIQLDEEEALRKQQAFFEFEVGPPPSPPTRHIENFLRLMTSLYNEIPELADDFWKHKYEEPQAEPPMVAFIKDLGESLSQDYFGPYIALLTSLAPKVQFAEHVFDYVNSLSHNPLLHWKTFVEAMANHVSAFREPQSDSGMLFRGVPSQLKEMPPEDVDAFICVLRQKQRIVRLVSRARQMLVEYQALDVYFDLLVCPVPRTLKSELLNTIAAFAKDGRYVIGLWRLLERSQLLSDASKSEEGIRFELEEREAREQEYVLTIAFLGLLDQLVEQSSPESLNALRGTSGFKPYLDYVISDVFLKFDTRAYVYPQQQWLVASRSLRIFLQLLEGYGAYLMDERGSGTHPGIAVMRAFLTGTAPVLRKLLKIFVQPYDWESLPYAKQIEEAVLLALKVLYRVMLNDASFLNQLRLAPKSEQDLATPIDKLLLRERSDIIRILKHAGQESNPLIALYAVRITSLLSERIPAMLVTIILDSKEGPAIKQAFVARLDDPVTLPVQREPEEDLPADDDDAQAIQQELREATHATREAIIHLMTHNLDNALPTIAHFLLGFDVSQRSFDKNDLVRSQPSCFHSILRLLVDATLSTTNASLIASCYELIHNLCANIQTYRPVLKALQSKQYDFFMKQIYRLPKQTTPQAAAHQLEQWSWFLKADRRFKDTSDCIARSTHGNSESFGRTIYFHSRRPRTGRSILPRRGA
eukprot:TRINITY_DN4630_c0_g1_i6.p1 TRINITY_DN4630_c0_g1~~TRINITY_DN4630_c0_g1_i6.p1  ORF type:complete len:939 (+),score=96.06 TRINITY_DN4630_c0_g1_i6:448-3264(+)